MSFARLSRIFLPQVTSHSTARLEVDHVHQLLESYGFIRHCAGAGLYHFLPMGHRVLDKLVQLVDKHMTYPDLAAQRIRMPALVPSSLWKTTGAYGSSETHEESITNLVAQAERLSHRHYPLRLYQITSKFRDEMKPRFGLMRAREFIMKDMYTFDVDEASAKLTYQAVRAAYRKLFDDIGVQYVEVAGSTGAIGGSLSHEFHIVADVGEDDVRVCRRCSQGINAELDEKELPAEVCPESIANCRENHWDSRKGIEVGHAFLLGDRYSAPLKAEYKKVDGGTANLSMGCYGLGVSRIMGAVLEGAFGDGFKERSDENCLRWPLPLAPYSVMLVPPKAGSREGKQGAEGLLEFVGRSLVDEGLVRSDDVVVDDRDGQTIGKRLLNARRLGIPFVLIAGKASVEPVPKFELVDTHRGSRGESCFLTALELKEYLGRKLRRRYAS